MVNKLKSPCWQNRIKNIKQHQLQTYTGNMCRPVVIAEKDGQIVMTVIGSSKDNKEDALKICSQLSIILEADAICMVCDTHTTTKKLSLGELDELQENMSPGYLQDLARKHDGIKRGIVEECLTALLCYTDGEPMLAAMRYETMHPPGGLEYIEWKEPMFCPEDDGDHLGGALPETLQRIMSSENRRDCPAAVSLRGMISEANDNGISNDRISFLMMSCLVHNYTSAGREVHKCDKFGRVKTEEE